MKRNHYKIIVYVALILLIAIPMIGLSSWVVINDFLVKPKYNPNSAFYIYLQNQSVTYNYEEQMPNLDLFKKQYLDLNKNGDVSDDNVTIMWKYRVAGDTTNKYSSDLAKPTNAGTYYFYFWCNIDEVDEGVAKELEEENALYPTEVKFTIDKATATPSEFNVKYDKTDENGVKFFATKQLSPNDFSYKFTYLDKEVAGSISISSELEIGTRDYDYTFTPDDKNFDSYKGKVSIITYATINFHDSLEITNEGILFTKYVPEGIILDPLDNPTTSDLEKSELYDNIKGFKNWVYNDENKTVCTKLENITKNIDLYATYTLSYTITYLSYDGKNSGKSMTEEWEYSDFGTKELYSPTAENLYFNGWIYNDSIVTSLTDPDDYTLTSDFRWIIPRVINSISYSSTVTFNNLFTDYQITCKDGTEIDHSTTFSISYMENGVYYYGDSTGKDTTGLKAGPLANVVGSTYLAYITINDIENYILENIDAAGTYVDGNSGYVAFQYKTVVVGSTYYTIEEAINYANSTTCTFRTKGNETTYVETCFTRKDFSGIITGYSDNYTYTVGNGSTLLVSYKDDTTKTNEKLTDDAGLSNVVYSVLTVPSGVTLNINSELTVGAYINAVNTTINRTSQITRRGVVLNNGIINMNANSSVYSFGYIKGSGKLNLKASSTAYDFMAMYDFPGGNNSSNIKDTTFPVNAWSCHNIACSTEVAYNSSYKAYYKVTMSNVIFWDPCGIVADSNSVFKGISGYLIKSTSGMDLQNITLHHTELGQKEILEVYGEFSDNTFSVSMSVLFISVSLKPDKNISMPISYMDVYIKANSKMNLEKMDYLFMPGTKVVVEKGGEVTIDSGVDLVMLSTSELSGIGGNRNFVDNELLSQPGVEDSKLIVNGRITCNGNLGGLILTETQNAILDISSGNTISRYSCLISTADTIVKSNSQFKSEGYVINTANHTQVSLENKNLESQNYYSAKSTNNNYGWCVDSGVGTLTYNSIGGIVNPTQTPLVDVSAGYNLGSLTLPIPTRAHYTFGGWYLEDSYQTTVSEFIDNQWRFKDYYIFESTTLYAKWIPIEYTLIFNILDADGSDVTGVYIDQNNISVNANNFPYNLIEPSRDGYIFDGWYTVENFTSNVGRIEKLESSFDPNLIQNNNINVYAKWMSVSGVAVKFATGIGSAIDSDEFDVGETMTLPGANSTTATGYTLSGWLCSYDNEVYEPGETYTVPNITNITFTAQWEAKKYTITFNTNGGSSVAAITQDYGSAITAPSNPTKTGHTFTGWDKAIPSTMPAEDITITAQWKINQYTITFNSDGGTDVSPITRDYGTVVTLSATPSKKATIGKYTFAGWKDSNGNTYKVGSTITITGDITLTAQWNWSLW